MSEALAQTKERKMNRCADEQKGREGMKDRKLEKKQ